MGSWNINIQGEGSHHNELHAQDANRMAAEFVQRLRDAGHTVSGASFTYGGADWVDGQAYIDTRDEAERATIEARRGPRPDSNAQ